MYVHIDLVRPVISKAPNFYVCNLDGYFLTCSYGIVSVDQLTAVN